MWCICTGIRYAICRIRNLPWIYAKYKKKYVATPLYVWNAFNEATIRERTTVKFYNRSIGNWNNFKSLLFVMRKPRTTVLLGPIVLSLIVFTVVLFQFSHFPWMRNHFDEKSKPFYSINSSWGCEFRGKVGFAKTHKTASRWLPTIYGINLYFHYFKFLSVTQCCSEHPSKTGCEPQSQHCVACFYKSP